MFGFVLDPDGKTAYGALMSRKTDDGEVVIGKPVVAQFELATGKLLRSVEVPWGVAHLVSVKGGKMLYAFGQDIYKIDTTGGDLKLVETVPMFDKQMNILPFWDYAFDNGGVASMNYYTPEAMGLLLARTRRRANLQDIVLKGEPALAYSVILAPDRKTAYARDGRPDRHRPREEDVCRVGADQGGHLLRHQRVGGRQEDLRRRRRFHADDLRRADTEADEGAADGLRRHGSAPDRF